MVPPFFIVHASPFHHLFITFASPSVESVRKMFAKLGKHFLNTSMIALPQQAYNLIAHPKELKQQEVKHVPVHS